MDWHSLAHRRLRHLSRGKSAAIEHATLSGKSAAIEDTALLGRKGAAVEDATLRLLGESATVKDATLSVESVFHCVWLVVAKSGTFGMELA